MLATRNRILIVDDNAVNCAICEEILQDDYFLRVANNGNDALIAAAEFQPDLILLDVMMPDMDGFAVCRQLRQSARPWVKIVMVSARAQTEARIEGYEAGADDYLTKPFDEEELLAKVKVHLRLRNAEEINAVKDGLLEVLQHGNRTPMAGVLGGLDLLSLIGEDLSADECKEYLRSIHESAQRLQEWLAAGEFLVSLKAGKVRPDFARINAGKTIEATANTFCSKPEHAGWNLTTELTDECQLSADHHQFMILVERLLLHAHATSCEDSKAVLHVKTDNEPTDAVILSLEFDRTPLENDAITNLFEPFANPQTVLHNQADGMSLAIVREITVLHGGYVQARNLSDQRFLIRVCLPVTPDCLTVPTAQP